MSSEPELVLQLWETFKDAIPAGKREDTANKLIRVLGNYGIDLEDLAHDIYGEDSYLDKALEEYRELDDEDEDELEDY